MKRTLVTLIIVTLCLTGNAQLSVSKMLGKNSDQYKPGLGVFANYSFPLNEEANRSIVLEILDFTYFPPKNLDTGSAKAYLSIKLGYRYIFSETRTGFYIEPQAGYVRSLDTRGDGVYKDGVALAMEGGYSLEVGQRGNTILFGLKYEADNLGHELGISSLAFKVAYSFSWMRRER